MMMEISKQQEADLDVLLTLKVREFRKENIKTISKKEIKDFLFSIKWKSVKSLDTCDFVEDVMSIESNHIFDYLSIKAIQDAASLRIDDFMDLIAK